MSERFKRLISQVDAKMSSEHLNYLLRSKDNDNKLVALLTIREKVENDLITGTIHLDTAKEFLSDNDNDCKWQAFIIVGHFMETTPNECWQIIIEYGDSDEEDTRAAVATTLLEHYFERNPQLFDTRFREYKQLIKAGHKNLLRTLSICRSDWGSEMNHINVDKFLGN